MIVGHGAEEWTDYRLSEAGGGAGGLLSVTTVLENQNGDIHTRATDAHCCAASHHFCPIVCVQIE